MLYLNKETGDYGITFDELQAYYPDFLLIGEPTEFGVHVGYEETSPEQHQYKTCTETTPADGHQQWICEWRRDVAACVKEMQTEIDNKVMEMINRYAPFKDEYYAREDEAKAYKAGEIKEPGIYLQGYMDASGLNVDDAVGKTLEIAEKFRNAEKEIARLRMMKYKLNAKTSTEENYKLEQSILEQLEVINSQF